MKYDVLVNVCFLTAEEGGRTKPFTRSEYGCPMYIDNQAFDCRIEIPENFRYGNEYVLRVRFLSPDLVLPLLTPGKEIELWEMGAIAKGRVREIIDR